MVYEGQPAAAAKVPAYVTANTAQSGFVALYRKCVHLGCSVPFCDTSKWFECPCHGSKYSINGEYRSGPAPRSLDRFRVDIVGGKLVVDTRRLPVQVEDPANPLYCGTSSLTPPVPPLYLSKPRVAAQQQDRIRIATREIYRARESRAGLI